MKRDEVRISDAHLTAYLLTLGHPIRRVAGSPGRREFIFVDVPPETITSFYGGDDSVSARALRRESGEALPRRKRGSANN